MVAYALKNWKPSRPFEDDTFMKECMFLSEEMHWQGRIQRIDSISKPFLQNGLRLARNLDLIPSAKDDKKEEIEAFQEKLLGIAKHINDLQHIILSKPVNDMFRYTDRA